MEKATLNCPRERLFVNHLLVETPGLPGFQSIGNRGFVEVSVDVLGVQDQTALVRLPNIMAREDNTALIDVRYLN